MKCPKCRARSPVDAKYCPQCASPLVAPRAARASVSPAIAKFLPRLPHVLALPLLEYVRETVPYVKLHRMCDAAELLARFSASVLLADLLGKGKGKGRFPREGDGICPLEAALAQHLAAPTFASWRVMLEEASKHYSGGKGGAVCFVREMPDFARRLVQELGGNAGDPCEKLIPCRNLAAHFGRMPDGQAQKLLDAHGERFGRLFEACRFLGDYPLVARGTGSGLVKLMGTAIPASLVVLPKATMGKARAGRLYLLSRDKGELLDLSPLHTYQPVLVRTGSGLREAQRPPDRVPQVYFRAERDLAYLEYLTFAASAPHGQDAHGALERFKELFRLDDWREEAERRTEGEAARRKFAFRRLRQGLLAGFVGRGECLEKMSEALGAKREGGIVWMTGKAGSGKSALMAKFLELGKQGINQPERWVTTFHFFKAQEGPSCSRHAFLENALARLLPACGLSEAIEDEPRAREHQFTRVLGDLARREAERPWRPRSQEECGKAKAPFRRGVLFFLDGLDELLASDPAFPDFVLRNQEPGVVWFCAGQPLDALQKAFPPTKHCLHVFPSDRRSTNAGEREGGVPRMTRNEVYEYLITECPSAGYGLMRRDAAKPVKDRASGRLRYPNPFLDTLIAKSQGLPLYLYLAAQEVREGRLTFREGQESMLPEGMLEYYDRLLERMAIGTLNEVMTPIVMRLAVAKAPLTAEALHAFLNDVLVLRGGKGRRLLERALAFGHVMLRRAALSSRHSETTPGLGYAIYHDSFKQYLLDPTTRAVEGSREVAHEVIERTCAGWRAVKANPDALEYCLRFGPAHLIEGRRWEDVEALLTDLDFIEAKCAGGMTYELLRNYDAALEELPADRPVRRILELLSEAVRRDALSIVRHPTAVFQCLWNSCWWYDCPAAAGHRDSPEEGRPVGEPRRGEPKLHELMESWRRAKERRSPAFAWLRSLRPPPVRLGSGPRTIIPGHGAGAACVAYSSDGGRIAGGFEDGAVRIFDAGTGEELAWLRGHANRVNSVLFLPGDERVLSGSSDGTVRMWNVEDCRELRCLRTFSRGGKPTPVRSLAVSRDGAVIAAGCKDQTVRLWDAVTGEETACLRGHGGWVNSVAFSPDAGRVVSGSGDKTLRVWDLGSGDELACLRGHDGRVLSARYSPEGDRIVSGAEDRTLRIWDARSCEEAACLLGHEGPVTSVAMSPGGRSLISGAADGTARIWDPGAGEERARFDAGEGAVNGVAFEPESGRIAAGSGDGTIRVWDADRMEDSSSLGGHGGEVRSVAFSSGGRRLLTTNSDAVVRVWSASRGTEAARFRSPGGEVRAAAFSRTGSRIAVGLADGTVRILDVESGRELSCLKGHEHRVTQVLFSREGGRLVSSAEDRTVRVWNAGTGALLLSLLGHEDAVVCVLLTPDESRIVSGSEDKTVRVWDARNGKELACFCEQEGYVLCLACSPDGRLIAGGTRDGAVRVWDVGSGQEVRCLRAPAGPVTSVAFLPDGGGLMSGSEDDTVRIWDVETGRCLKVLPGKGDVPAMAAGASVRAIVRGTETVVEDSATGEPAAWLPVRLEHLAAHSAARVWAGASGAHLYIFALEGGTETAADVSGDSSPEDTD